MPKITSVELQKKSASRQTKRFNVYLDGVFAFGADEDLVVDYRLIPGKVLDKPLLDKLLFEAEVGKLMERMYGLFSVRQRSGKEVRDYLKNFSFKRKVKGKEELSEAAIELLIEKLSQKRLINDLEFAKSWVEARRKTKQKGLRALKTELFQKGIDREIIEQVLSGEFTGESEEDLAKRALEKKMRVWKNLPALEFKKKAYAFLMRRGFEYEIVKDVIEKFTQKG